MTIYANLVELEIHCPPEAVYDLVATPDNWPKLHPSTAAVVGATAAIAGVGVVFDEQIRRADGFISATWEVTKAERGVVWEFRSRRFGELPIVMTISYELAAIDAGTFVRRFMRTDVRAGHVLPREAAIHFSLPDIHERFLAIVKEHLERRGKVSP